MESRIVRRRVVAVSLVLVTIGVLLGARTASFVRSAEIAPGEVVSVGQLATGGQGFPVVISWEDEAGTARHLRTRAQRPQLASFQAGAAIEVIYDPENPGATARVNRATRVWLWPGICLFAGVLFFALQRPIAREATRNRDVTRGRG